MVAASPRSSADPASGDEPEHRSSQGEVAQGAPDQRDPVPHGVDPDGVEANQEPSAEWGWHGRFPRAGRIAGWSTAAAMFLMLIGNHENNVENWWLIGLGATLVMLLVADWRKSRSPWHS